MTSTEVAGVSPEEYLSLDNELKAFMKAQAQGDWEKKPNETQEQNDARVQQAVRRCIELTSILRRSNTGPAKPKSSRSKKNKDVDIAALAKDLLG